MSKPMIGPTLRRVLNADRRGELFAVPPQATEPRPAADVQVGVYPEWLWRGRVTD